MHHQSYSTVKPTTLAYRKEGSDSPSSMERHLFGRCRVRNLLEPPSPDINAWIYTWGTLLFCRTLDVSMTVLMASSGLVSLSRHHDLESLPCFSVGLTISFPPGYRHRHTDGNRTPLVITGPYSQMYLYSPPPHLRSTATQCFL